MSTTNVDIAVLEAAADSIIQSSLVRSTLVQPGAVVSSYPELSEKFEKAASLYRAGAFHEAKERFYSLESSADSGRPNIFTARLNAAACAASSKDWPVVVDLLAPLFKAGNLYGHPLWNLALAWHYLGLTSDALKALEVWVSKNHEWHRARGLLLIAAIALKIADKTKAVDALQRAVEASSEFVAADQLQSTPTQVPRPLSSNSRSQRPLAPGVHSRLLGLVQPKRPERRPELYVLLPGDDMEVFTTAIEEIAEGRLQQAKEHLTELEGRHPTVQHVRFAIGACELFTGKNERARTILLPAIESGAKSFGSALWNLACAQIRLGNLPGARNALLKCAKLSTRRSRNSGLHLVFLPLRRKAPVARESPRPNLSQPVR